MKEKVLITSALPYANGPQHFGHIAGAYLPGDCYARFCRLQGKEVLYVCGSDEHGVAITLSAEMAGRSPKEHVDCFHAINRDFFRKLGMSFDFYGRTTWEGHVKTTQDFFFSLQKKGLIEARTENHLFSEAEQRFLADRYVVGICPKCGFAEARGDECQKCASSYEATDLKSPRSKLTGSPLTLKPSEHLYLRFDKFKEELKKWLNTKQWKSNVLHFAMSYVNDLKPRAITRDSDWGVPVPGYPNKVFYVWFDAPIGYVSIAQEWAQQLGQPDRWKDFWLDEKTKLVQFLGKDNIPFHAVFFPAMLMGQDLSYKLPDEIPANEFFLLEGRQFSKSDGWTIDLDSFFTKYTPDQARYAIAANAPETADSEFSWEDFHSRCNAELLGKLGNFVHRTLVFIRQKGELVRPNVSLSEKDPLILEIQSFIDRAEEAFSSFHLRKACQILMDLAQWGNGYFDHQKPWVLAKDPAKKEELEKMLAICLECIKGLALLSSPIIPETAQKIWNLLGFSTELAKQHWTQIRNTPIPSGQKLPEPFLLFRKIEEEEMAHELSLLKAPKPKESPSLLFDPLKPQIAFDEFTKLDLRIGQILEVEPIPKSKKLYKLLVDLGFETRTIVSGIALSYEKEALIGKKVVIVANLAPVQIMGVESRGMLLASHLDKELELPLVHSMSPGSIVS